MKQEVRRGRKFIEYHDPDTQDEFTFTQEISGADVSYQETDGSWHPADENWQTDGLDGFILKNDKLNHKVRLKGTGGRTWYPRRNVNTEYMTFGVPQYWNGKRWANFSFSGWSVEGKTITLNTRQGVTILVHNRWNGIKIDWVLASSTAPSRMRYPVSLTGITYVDGIIYGADGTRLGQLTPTTATDANGAELVCSGSFAGGYVEFQADVTGAVYPVTIDPDFSVGSSGGDTYIRSANSTNYGTSDTASFIVNRNILIRFPLTSVASGSTITAAGIRFNATSGWNAPGMTMNEISDANGDWGETTCSWLYKVNATTTGWAGSAGLATSGTDYKTTEFIGSSSITYQSETSNTRCDIVVSSGGLSAMEGWCGQASNNGLIFRTTSGSYTFVAMKEHATESYRPVLTVTYTAAATGTLRRTNMNAQMSNLTGGMHG